MSDQAERLREMKREDTLLQMYEGRNQPSVSEIERDRDEAEREDAEDARRELRREQQDAERWDGQS